MAEYGEIRRVAPDGLEELVLSGQTSPVALALDDTSIYFCDYATGDIARVTMP